MAVAGRKWAVCLLAVTGLSACVAGQEYDKKAYAKFASGSCDGTMMFEQAGTDPTKISLNLTLAQEVLKPGATYSVSVNDRQVSGHNCYLAGDHWDPLNAVPTAYINGCAANRTFCMAGDIGNQYGLLNTRNRAVSTAFSMNLTLEELVNRSVSIMHTTYQPYVCATIERSHDNPDVAIARFVDPIVGTVEFTRKDAGGVEVFTRLTSKAGVFVNNPWFIMTDPVFPGDDHCTSLGSYYDPTNVHRVVYTSWCQGDSTKCALGDINLRTTTPMTQFENQLSLHVDDPSVSALSAIGRSVVIEDHEGWVYCCANVFEYYQPRDQGLPVEQPNDELSGGAIAAIVIGCLCVVALMMGGAFWYLKRNGYVIQMPRHIFQRKSVDSDEISNAPSTGKEDSHMSKMNQSMVHRTRTGTVDVNKTETSEWANENNERSTQWEQQRAVRRGMCVAWPGVKKTRDVTDVKEENEGNQGNVPERNGSNITKSRGTIVDEVTYTQPTPDRAYPDYDDAPMAFEAVTRCGAGPSVRSLANVLNGKIAASQPNLSVKNDTLAPPPTVSMNPRLDDYKSSSEMSDIDLGGVSNKGTSNEI